jgi:signal transduction histidine kinase
MSNQNQINYINFNFDVSAYRLLGRELITDRITALFEIVKNSYDANANRVSIEFYEANPKSLNSKIIIKDDGLGMDLSDIENKWMVIGTSSKRKERQSPSPYARKVSGKKGVGRFAVDKLGSKLVLKTKKSGTNQRICLETDWSYYAELETGQLTLDFSVKREFFTDIKNKYWFEDAPVDEQGTTLEITSLNDIWTEEDIKRAYKELSKIVSPNIKTLYPFKIFILAPSNGFQEEKEIKIDLVDFATEKIELNYNLQANTQQIIQSKNGELVKIDVEKRPFGLISIQLFYFNEEDKKRYKSFFKSDIDGIKIYRDGIITTPFAEYEADQNKQKDILGIDKRRYSGFFDRLSTRDLLGFVEISDEHNSEIIEATNRQDFVDNLAWQSLKSFIIEQVYQLEKYLKTEKKEKREQTKSELGSANDNLKSIKKSIANVKKNASPEVKKQLQNIEADLGKLQGAVNKSIKNYNKLEEETKQQENLFFSLVTLQTFAGMFSHMAQTTIGRIIGDAEYFNDNFPNEKFENRFKIISKRIFKELLNLRSGVSFMLKYAKSDNDIEEINLYDLLDNLFNSVYTDIFRVEKINSMLEIDKNLSINYNKKAIEDIFDNLISNSIKSLKNRADKTIKCSGIISSKEIILNFSDNGIGVKEEDRFRVFDIFYTTTAEEGGAGLGLFMVKTRIEAMQGEIEIVKNEFNPTGATFKITLPFQK